MEAANNGRSVTAGTVAIRRSDFSPSDDPVMTRVFFCQTLSLLKRQIIL
jgi:hypothetical protein